MFNPSNFALLRQAIEAVETIMVNGGMPKGLKLKRIQIVPEGLCFTMHDDSEWTAKVTLSKTKEAQ